MPRQRGDGGKSFGERSSSWAGAIDAAAFCVKHCSRAPDLPMEPSPMAMARLENLPWDPVCSEGMGARIATRTISLTKATG
jgi:hypothetical protein